MPILTWGKLIEKIPLDQLDKPVRLVVNKKDGSQDIFLVHDLRDYHTNLSSDDIELNDFNSSDICLFRNEDGAY